MRRLQAVRGVGSAKFAGLHNESNERRSECEEKHRISKPGIVCGFHERFASAFQHPMLMVTAHCDVSLGRVGGPFFGASGSIILRRLLGMDGLNNAGLGARRNEDIALDLLKFVAGTSGVGRPAAGSTGFSGAAGSKPEDHVNQLLELYSRCLKAVEGKGA